MQWPTRKQLEENNNKIVKTGQSYGITKVIFRLITGAEAKNADGSPSGWIAGTLDGDRICIEKETIYSDGKRKYSNRW